MAKSKNMHVVLIDDSWIVEKEDTYRAISVHTTQRAAIEAARKMARSQQSELVIHGRNGRVRKRYNYSPDRPVPEPPKVLFPSFRASRSKKAIMEAVVAAMRELESSPKNGKRAVNTMK